MRKHFFIFIFLIVSAFINAQPISIETLRKEYHNLSTDSAACVRLFEKISSINSSDNLIAGYKGATTTAMANFAKGNAEKIKLFNSGKKLLEQSIRSDSTNAELRFLRFTIQTSSPKALGYNSQIENDKKYILSHFDQINSKIVKSRISEYMVSKGKLSDEEKQKLKSPEK